MFSRYFPDRYFPPRYFGNVGAAPDVQPFDGPAVFFPYPQKRDERAEREDDAAALAIILGVI